MLQPLLHAHRLVRGSDGGFSLLHKSLNVRGGGKKGTARARKKGSIADDGGSRPGTMVSEQLLAGNVRQLQFLRAKTGIDLGVGCAVLFIFIFVVAIVFLFWFFLFWFTYPPVQGAVVA